MGCENTGSQSPPSERRFSRSGAHELVFLTSFYSGVTWRQFEDTFKSSGPGFRGPQTVTCTGPLKNPVNIQTLIQMVCSGAWGSAFLNKLLGVGGDTGLQNTR